MIQLLLLVVVVKEVGNAMLQFSDLHPISPKTPAPQLQPIEENTRKGKQQKTKRERADSANNKALDLPLEPTSPTPLNTGVMVRFAIMI